jgi:histidinol-phosphate aminotransferase
MTTPRYKWQPTTAEIAARLGIPERQVVRFDHNTSPFPTDWAPGLVIETARTLNEYPGADYRGIRESAARYMELTPENIVPGAGIDELLLLTAQAFLEPGGSAATVVPTYPLYRIAALQRRAELYEVPLLRPDFGYSTDPLLAAAAEADLLWLCVPNNPTGNRLADAELAAAISACSGVVVLDAAYAEIAGDSWGPWIERFDNLLVCHTLSKGFGLAGARVGFAAGHPQLIDAMDAVRPPGSISTLSADLATAALDEPARMHRRVDRLLRERTRLGEALRGLNLTVLPSEANFFLCHVGPQATRIADRLMSEGLVPRSFSEDGPLGEHLRFTIRSPEEDDRLLNALWRYLA